ncbi:MAG TPA: HD domain-containing phosphohydrolase [Dissulfurispiraceae bacterium]|nr:HD domain-containing phosphohydrolase [Dissulfurispiraceae bacterium]
MMRRSVYVVDDVSVNLELVESVFIKDHSLLIRKAENGKELMKSIEAYGRPDLLILDLMMPVMDGFEVLEKLKQAREAHYFPIIVLSALSDKQSIVKALSMGADDYVTKPFFVEELKARVGNMLKLKERDECLNTSLDVMESNLIEKLQIIEQTQMEVIIRLGKAAEFRDDETGRHIERIAVYVNLITETLGMNRDQRLMMGSAAPMHDVGKIGIPDGVLMKAGKLTADEFKIIKLHTVIGSRILSGTTLPLLELAKEIALSHHERWDGGGYPLGLKGSDIPVSGRIVAITDVFDALTSKRVYKEAWPIEQALEYISDMRGKQFDPDIVDAFFAIENEITKVRQEKGDESVSKPMILQIIDGDIGFEQLTEQWR